LISHGGISFYLLRYEVERFGRYFIRCEARERSAGPVNEILSAGMFPRGALDLSAGVLPSQERTKWILLQPRRSLLEEPGRVDVLGAGFNWRREYGSRHIRVTCWPETHFNYGN